MDVLEKVNQALDRLGSGGAVVRVEHEIASETIVKLSAGVAAGVLVAILVAAVINKYIR